MAAREIDGPPKQRRRLRLWHILAGLLLLAVAGLLLRRWHWRHEFLRGVEAIRAGGSPVTLEELDKWYQWPESGENAAAAVLNAASCYVPPAEKAAEETLWSILRGQGVWRAEPLDQDTRTMLAEHLKANEQALGFLHDAAAIEGSRYPMDLSKGYGQFPTYVGEVVNKANILPCLEAILHAENGDPRRASEAVITSLAVTRSLAWEPMVICQINRLTCERVAWIALQRILSRVNGFTDDQLLALSRALARASDTDSWTRALIGERCIIIAMHERPELVQGAVGPSPPQIVINAQKELGLADRSGVAFLKRMDRLMQVRQLPPEQRLDAAAEVDKERHALPKTFFIIHEVAPYAVGVVKWELTETAKALEMLHDATSVVECRYPIDLSQGSIVTLPHIVDVRDGCLLLCSKAILCAEDGDPNGATRAIEAALRVACSLDQEPIMLSHFMHMKGVSWAAGSLEWALNATSFPQEQLARLNRAFGSVHANDTLLRAIAGDRCLFLGAFERPQVLGREHRFPKPPPAALLEMYGAVGLSAREGAIFLDRMEEWLRIAQLPAFQRPAAIKAQEVHYARGRKGVLWGLADARDMPAMMGYEFEHVAQLEVAKTLLAVERYRLAHASLPETLDQLVPDYLAAVPVDPFDEAPLRYKRFDRGFLVYSVGEDGKDDGGKQEPKKTDKSGETWDLVFRIERQG